MTYVIRNKVTDNFIYVWWTKPLDIYILKEIEVWSEFDTYIEASEVLLDHSSQDMTLENYEIVEV